MAGRHWDNGSLSPRIAVQLPNVLQYPVAVGWLNGHTHLNQILAHRRAGGGGRGYFIF